MPELTCCLRVVRAALLFSGLKAFFVLLLVKLPAVRECLILAATMLCVVGAEKALRNVPDRLVPVL
jgi:hypothetical protein